MINRHSAVCRGLCKSRKFETGQGTCAPICMEQLGSARDRPGGCSKANEVFATVAEQILEELDNASN